MNKRIIMTTAQKFEAFCNNLRMSDNTVSNVRSRYKAITKNLNKTFWNLDSEVSNSRYVGSYGRGTAIHASDIDIIVKLPYETYSRFNAHSGNGQSALLYAVRDSLQSTYSTTHIKQDGQVVGLKFNDGISFEIVPGFINTDKVSYTYPDTNNGGSWKTTNPVHEIDDMTMMNTYCNKNLKRLCRMARAWKETWSVPISGMLIDTLAYNFIKDYAHKDASFIYYDYITRDFLKFLKDQNPNQSYWYAPGSNQCVYRKGIFENKALRAYNISLEAVALESEGKHNLANEKWRQIYGTKFPN